jgi:arsenical pump membrane protein
VPGALQETTALLLLAELCDRQGLFQAAGSRMAAAARGRPVRLLGLVFLTGSAVTAALSLDATVVLLTPVVFATAARLRLRPRPHVYACTHLANTASLLLPVSNLTNLLAFRASGLSFARFAAAMTLPWLAAIGVEWLMLRRYFASDLVGRGELAARPGGDAPLHAVVVLGLTLAGFGLAEPMHVGPAVVAALGATALAVPALRRRRVDLGDLARAVAAPFLVFVAALAVVVRAVSAAGLGPLVERLVPAGGSPWSLLAVAALAAALANLVNNLPAILLLLPVAAAAGPGTVLAALIGTNVGPNLTYVGSLATLLWRRALRERHAEPPTAEFLRLGVLTVPVALLAATMALWLALRALP